MKMRDLEVGILKKLSNLFSASQDCLMREDRNCSSLPSELWILEWALVSDAYVG